MTVSRRTLLVAGPTLLTATALPMEIFGQTFARGFRLNTANLAVMTKENFLPLVSSSFAVSTDSITRAWFTLLSVEEMNSQTPVQVPSTFMAISRQPAKNSPQIDTFVLRFYGTGETLAQGTYDLEHPTLGQFPLFVVPSGTTTYAAIISHLLNPGLVPGTAPVKPKARGRW